MASFDKLLENLHGDVSGSVYDSPSSNGYIVIDGDRQLKPTENFDKVVAYEGDINSAIITFVIKAQPEGHLLSKCDNITLKWKNLSSNLEGTIKLESTIMTIDNSGLDCLQWLITPKACTEAGTLEISLHFSDGQEDDPTYQWNTATYSGLTIGQSNRNVGDIFPAKDEILVIDRETKNIVAPKGYRNVICNYGEVGVSNVYFQISKYLDKKETLDVMEADINIYAFIGGRYYSINPNTISKKLYTTNFEESGDVLVLLKWEVEEGITAGTFGAGKLRIAIEFKHNGKIWISNEYGNLEIGKSILQIDVDPQPGATTEETIISIVENLLANNDFIIDPN